MRMATRRWPAVTAAAAVVLLAACTGPDATPAASSPAATRSAAPSATPTPTPTPTGGVQDQSDEALGIVFEDVPELTGDEADVWNWIATYEKEYWRTMTTNEVSPAFSAIGSAAVRQSMERVAEGNAKIDAKIGGTFHVEVGGVTVDGDTATGVSCDDFADATFEDENGTYTPEEAGFDEPRRKSFTLVRGASEGIWKVETVKREGTC
ncbi:hypothetical protein [Cellulomonas massiliensis]|uniref:hypothetical protein n=1 Tax=Cellulomonas massiliensis TaxID=1465811 RepID=UPI000361DA1B|nr:hypothetical protein [Cellulomonas massiliensis]